MKRAHKLVSEYMEKVGSRYTMQKKAIVDELCKVKTHFEVDDFIVKMHQKDNDFSRATVYRVIKQLLEGGFLQKINTKDGKVFYEQNFGDKLHDHIICNNCGRIQEIKDDLVGDLLDKYCLKINFEADYRSLHIYGLCDKCQKKA
ncbi:MAG: transcriptional repressor [bacterium]|nr:transcriptional repressor [bacterium]